VKLDYLALRITRHFLPEKIVRFMLLRGWVIHASTETMHPQAAINRYLDVIGLTGFQDKDVLVFGYGGRFDIGLGLLEAGAKHVTLCDKFAPSDDPHNATLLQRYPKYLFLEDGRARPRPEHITLLQGDIRDVKLGSVQPFDIVVSNSVYEHLDDVDGITRALATLTQPDGLHIHHVDLRDHYFKYPFEMLHYSGKTWYGWLNPTSNHNRFRLWNYKDIFEKYFEDVQIEVLERNETAFEKARPRIRPEFTSGNLQDDSVTLIRVAASRPRKLSQ
jgi:SAM-dependent methyltransferase